jgi:aspartate/tyrosine/aromatic aminotransferase
VYFSDPTWENHYNIFERGGFTDLRSYPYMTPGTHVINFEGMKECLLDAPSGAVILLHACAHNPTGVDLTES